MMAQYGAAQMGMGAGQVMGQDDEYELVGKPATQSQF
jgi:hypothetical protein